MPVNTFVVLVSCSSISSAATSSPKPPLLLWCSSCRNRLALLAAVQGTQLDGVIWQAVSGDDAAKPVLRRVPSWMIQDC